MPLLQNNTLSLPTQSCATSIRTVGTNGASVVIREGQPTDRWGNTAQTTPCARRNTQTHFPSVCMQVMIMSYERHWQSTHNTETRKYGQHRGNKMWERTSNIYLLFYYTKNITANVWKRDYLIRPLLITVIGHSASQECKWPIAFNLLSSSLLLPPS